MLPLLAFGQLRAVPQSTTIKPCRTTIIRPDFDKYFRDCQVNGAIVIYDNAKQMLIVSDTLSVKTPVLPASTF